MRTTMAWGSVGRFDWGVLRHEEHFLYRRMADRDRAVLAVGVRAWVEEPVFVHDGRVADWVFGAVQYEWKEVLFGEKGVDKDHCAWFIPRYVVEWRGGHVFLHAPPDDIASAKAWMERAFGGHDRLHPGQATREWVAGTTRVEYIRRVEHLLARIQRGDIYEVNYCTTRRSHDRAFDPFRAFETLLDRSMAPFAGFHRSGHRFALCASPERFLAFDGRSVIAEPMKGTRPRHGDPEEDRCMAEALALDGKERSENIMALDVMRHDLSRIAASRSVHVLELCAVRTYPRVHQMVSTVAAEIRDGLSPMDVLRAAFPMASMTGAPKRRAVELIEEVESGPRGLFSGCMGFFAPDGTADLNVVIRTVLFDSESGELSLTTGSAITAQCDPASEYEECEVKARAVIDALDHA